MNFSELSLRLHALSVFRPLLDTPVLACLMRYLDCRRENAPTAQCVDAYAQFTAALYATESDNLAVLVQDLVFDNENSYVRCIGKGQTPAPALQQTVEKELATLQTVANLTHEDLCAGLEAMLPLFPQGQADIEAGYGERVAQMHTRGFGMYAKYHMFYVENGAVTPVRHPDPVRLTDLVDYEREKACILENTRALLDGKPAANMLLTGDAGTGKSSTVKAVVNELYEQGLRIVEVRKEQLCSIPALLDTLSANPLKFILFIDDLSFAGNDDDYSALKAVLEGSVSAKSSNVVIYATSNRRHLMRESFAEREGDDVHFNDTMQEILSLSERFGIQLRFSRPDKDTYLDIVHHLVIMHDIDMPMHEVDLQAERFALARAGRSARAAKQFVDSLLAGEKCDFN